MKARDKPASRRAVRPAGWSASSPTPGTVDNVAIAFETVLRDLSTDAGLETDELLDAVLYRLAKRAIDRFNQRRALDKKPGNA